MVLHEHNHLPEKSGVSSPFEARKGLIMLHLTYAEWINCFLGARSIDDHIYPRLSMSEWMLDKFCFDDKGAHYIKNGEPDQPAREARG